MSSIQTLRRDAGSAPSPHDTLREGIALGLAVATATWVWLAIFDAAVGDPFRTFAVLGGIIAFTIVHYLLNIACGVAILSGVHGALRAPSLIFGLGFGVLMLELAFALVTAALAQSALGELAWIRIFGGSVIGVVLMVVIVERRHRLLQLLRTAEEET